MGEPPERLILPEGGYESLGILAELGREGIGRLIGELAKQQLTLDFEAIADHLAESLSLPGPDVDRLFSTILIPLNQARGAEQSAADFIRELNDVVERQASAEWKAKFGEKWHDIVPVLEPLFDGDRFLWLAARAIQLLYNRPALLLDFRILTELRPVYDESVTRLRAMILSNTLVITYQHDDQEGTLHLSIDTEDLGAIGEQLERVQKKTRLVRQEAKQWKVDILELDTAEAR
jgi:hypothetical protein